MPSRRQNGTAARPNILWIVSTQWRAQACGFSGDPNARTPALDALAAQSLRFAEAVTPHPFGPFARAALFTGLPSPENGIRDYFDSLPIESPTIAGELEAGGYDTAFFGKWHLGRRDPAAPLVGDAHARSFVPPEARGGFGFWEGFESGFLLNNPWLHGTRLERPVRFEGYQSDVLCGRAADWIGVHPGPWFCVVSLEAPHPPYDAPAAGVARRDPREIILAANVPRGGETEARARRELSGYYAHIEATDRAVGRLLKAPGLAARPAAVVFTSVHGDMHGAHGLFRKGWPHEESIRVPLLVRLPDGEERRPAVKTSQLASLLDLPRWTRAWAGLSGAGAWSGEFQSISMPSVVRLPHQCDRVWRGLRTARRKLVLGADRTPWLYFDLEADPMETANLAEDPARAAEIRELGRLLP